MAERQLGTLNRAPIEQAAGWLAAKIPLILYRRAGDAWEQAGSGTTDEDGRCATLAHDGPGAAVYRLVFDTEAYFRAVGICGFYPEVSISFRVTEPERHHHVPPLLSPYAYSTYRGS